MTDATPDGAAKFTLSDFHKAADQIRRQSHAHIVDPIFVGDDFVLAKAMVNAGRHIICSPRVRTLLGEHLED